MFLSSDPNNNNPPEYGGLLLPQQYNKYAQ